jgi:putative redox protein
MKTNLSWKTKMQFVSQTRGHENILDAPFESGGLNQGANPKEFVLQGLAGCTAMDAIFYLNKHNLVPLSFDVEAEATMTSNTMPTYFEKVHLVFKFFGDQLPKDKVIFAVEKSMTKYCGVSFMLHKVSPISYSIVLNNQSIFEGASHFS